MWSPRSLLSRKCWDIKYLCHSVSNTDKGPSEIKVKEGGFTQTPGFGSFNANSPDSMAYQWLSTFLMLPPFNTIPRAVVTLLHKIISQLTHNCDLATAMHWNVNIWYATSNRGHNPQVGSHCLRGWRKAEPPGSEREAPVHLTSRKQRDARDRCPSSTASWLFAELWANLWCIILIIPPALTSDTSWGPRLQRVTLWKHFVSKPSTCCPCLAFFSVLKLGIPKASLTYAASAKTKYFSHCKFFYTWMRTIERARTETVSLRRKSQVEETLLNVISYNLLYLLLMNSTSSFQNSKASEDYIIFLKSLFYEGDIWWKIDWMLVV